MKLKNIALLSMMISGASFNSYAFFGSDDDSLTIKVSHYFSESNPHHQALLQFADELKKNSDGKITVKIFPNGTLGSEEQSINGVRNGTVEIALVGSLMQQNHPMLGAFEFPFLMKDQAHALRVLNGEPGKQVQAKYGEYKVHHLAYSISGFRHLTSNKKVETQADYKGLRIRVPNNSLFIDMATALGWSAQALSLAEVYTALEQGVVDGQENPYSLIDAQGFYEVQDYIIETNHMFTNLHLLYSQQKWSDLDDAQKTMIQNAADNYTQNSWDMTVNNVNLIKEKIIKSGTQILIPSAELNAYNRQAVEGMKAEYIENNPWADEFFKSIAAIQ